MRFFKFWCGDSPDLCAASGAGRPGAAAARLGRNCRGPGMMAMRPALPVLALALALLLLLSPRGGLGGR